MPGHDMGVGEGDAIGAIVSPKMPSRSSAGMTAFDRMERS
jgi:hypothetical protein